MERQEQVRKQLLEVIQQAEQQGVIIDRIRIKRSTEDNTLQGLTLDYELKELTDGVTAVNNNNSNNF